MLDTETMRWEPGPTLRDGRCGCCAILLEEGLGMVAGGINGFEGLASTEVLERKMELRTHARMGTCHCPPPAPRAPPPCPPPGVSLGGGPEKYVEALGRLD